MSDQSSSTFPVVDAPPEGGTFLGQPLNRWVAFLGPHISWVAGLIAAWLVAKVNLPQFPGLDQANVATLIAGALTFAVVSGLTWLGHQKWLKGHHIELAAANVLAAGDASGEPDDDALDELSGPIETPAGIEGAAPTGDDPTVPPGLQS